MVRMLMMMFSINLFAMADDIVGLVGDLEREDLENDEKFEIACTGVGDIIDENLDSLPWWEELTESQRDSIIKGAVEAALAIYRWSVGGKASSTLKARRWRRRYQRMLTPLKS